MWVYWYMFLVPAAAALFKRRLPARQSWGAWVLVALSFAAIIGLRDQVGGDWSPYERSFFDVQQAGLAYVLSRGDPAYYLLSWVVARVGGGFHLFNLVCAIVVMYGVVRFVRRQPVPWLALAVAVPYLLIVVAMGYSRQSLALAISLLGLVALADGRVRAFVLWVCLASLFHKSAVLLLPVAALASSRNKWLSVVLVFGASLLMYYLVVAESSAQLWSTYVESERESEGGFVRVAMNALAAVLFLAFRRRMNLGAEESKLWTWMAIFALICIPLTAYASTAVDRVALYFLPLQLFTYARLPGVTRSASVRWLTALAVTVLYAAVLAVWLGFSPHAQFWVPYQFASPF